MTFTPGIPTSGQTLGGSRTQILNNFANYNTVMSVNHVAPNDSGQGKHAFVEMPVQSPDPATLAGEGGLFTKTASGSSEMFFLRDAVATAYQMTGPFFSGQGALASGGTTMLFGGIILKWGLVSGAGAKLFVTECGSAFPNNCFGVVAMSQNGNSIGVSSVTTTGFTLAGLGNVFFIAMGN